MSNNKSQRKFGLLPKSADQGGTALSATELAPGFPPQLPEILGAKIGQRMIFKMAPNVFGGVQFRGISWKPSQNELTLCPFDVRSDNAAAMHGQAIPNDQQLARNLPAQVAQKLYRLLCTDSSPI